YLEEPKAPLAWNRKLGAKKIQGKFHAQPLITFEPAGDVLPFFQAHRVALELNSWRLKLIDRDSNAEYWNSPALGAANYLYENYANARHTYHAQGHVVFVNSGHMLYAFDVVAKKKLWEFNLYALGSPPASVQFSQDKEGMACLDYADGWTESLEAGIIVRPAYVCAQTRKSLVALDPVTGHMLWERSDLGVQSRIFGDDEHIFVVERQPDGVASGSKVLSARNSTLVGGVPDFAPRYERRLQIVGRNLLVKDDT